MRSFVDTRLVLVTIVAASAGVCTFWVTREVIAQQRLAEFANRPELENWISPYWNTTTPALTNSVLAAISVAGVVVMVHGLRGIWRTHELARATE